ncbi:RsmB/NOP family class I SAM-dependent RNA methyltransferase [Roseovarius rhodophyticola]|uniref:RsmB/NOP family class I SAM-dependent RNA methyltransferase n=1 Tax=Roseovarius rhodophyticola TaxID=3080827 RepID=A0ABZ2TNA0_9RHOB|nr:RsmB/NOP family class I SAM-dependent RNA methyltransferase [Roseovarius sp. W115]MDV2929950.1 RsmB/NOP family class I SAM-dependent RNA methyltransferase [Roseovarius sp. W115]
MTSRKTHSPRGAAVALLDQVIGQGRLLSETSGVLRDMAGAQRAEALRLATDTLRGLDRADRLLSRAVRKKPPLHVRNALRLGTVELCLGGDAHGVVSDLVGYISKNNRYRHLKGLVNAVLRQMADGAGKPWNDLRIPRLPKWLRDPLTEAWGNGSVSAMEAAHFSGAPLDVTAKSDPSGVAKTLGGTLLPTGSIRLSSYGQVSALEGFENGDWWVQDAAAAIPVQALKPGPGTRVLDMCAAPGGKTLQFAAAGAEVTAIDASDRRMDRVRENLERTKLSAELVVGDVLEFEAEGYDIILLDAPCSSTGTIRRHPDLPYAKDGSEFGDLIALQTKMLDHAVSLLAPGGRLMYCTCSLLPDEGEVQIEELLQRRDELRTDPTIFDIPGIDPEWLTEEGGLRLRPDYWPDLGGMDGFYMACVTLRT